MLIEVVPKSGVIVVRQQLFYFSDDIFCDEPREENLKFLGSSSRSHAHLSLASA